jgi:hypothetical protein
MDEDDEYVAGAQAQSVWYLSIESRGGAATHKALVGTLMRVPDNVRMYAVEKCVFVSTGATNGQCLEMTDVARKSAEYLIVLYDHAVGLEDVIAEEIAHAFLRHPDDPSKSTAAKDQDAKELARAWGFAPS